ncbi:MAG TPA: alpha-glucan family phosphorylase [Actinomycetota bacterium]|nr:alpha-glucan family phosphorylase [Actinomycetota bacterium]
MKALRSFAVRAALPSSLAALPKIATNLRWSWNPRAVDLFRWIDAEAWERSGHDPAQMLGLITRQRFQELTEDGPFMSFLANVEEDLQRYIEEPRWFQARKGGLKQVAYFSPEFGVSEALPIYSGGLGVLAGDHLKAASDLGVPLVGVGLLYREGYFRQELNADGWQQERYPELDPHAMPLTLLTGDDEHPLKIEVDLAGIRCVAQLWRAQVGRIPLLLMDCDVEENDEDERSITDRLYGGGTEHRLKQEIVLGIGGVRALEAAGYSCDVFHSNEGHAGFLGLERIRRLVTSGVMNFDEALEAVRAATVFTTHTPVPAGIDVYPGELMDGYFGSFVKECEITFERLMSLGSAEPVTDDTALQSSFNMAVMGLRLAGRANAVSKLHGEVSRSIFSALWPLVPDDESPIGSITNGVHTSTWLGPEIREVLDRRLSPGWTETGGKWDKVLEVPDSELWRARERARERLVYMVRERLKKQLLNRGMSEGELGWTDEVFDPTVLTIGFARRFAQYKRGTLLLSDIERLKRLLTSGDRPVQIVIAGKAHPLDDGGKEMIRALVHFSADPEVRDRFAFIEDYDMEIARILCQGADVWLNNPRRPLEACGTSGMKAALNGALNCSVLDGWWDECYDGENGWAIGTPEIYADHELQDRVEASALYDLLERDIVPRFYERPEGPVPRRWIERMKASISSLGQFVTADRMVRDYVTELYEPAATQGAAMSSTGFARARALAEWKERIRDAWEDVRVIEVDGDARAADVGEGREVTATVRLGRLDTEDIAVQLAHGRVGANGELLEPSLVKMEPDHCTDGTCSYRGSFTTESPGLYGFSVRVVPHHEDLTNQMDLGLVVWA